MKVVWGSLDEAMGGLERLARFVLLLVLILIGSRFYLVGMPKLESELDESFRASNELALTAMEARKASTKINTDLPTTVAQINKAIDGLTAVEASSKGALDSIALNVGKVGTQSATTLATVGDQTTQIGPVLESLKKTSDGIQPAEVQLTTEIASLHTLTANLARAAGDPALHTTAVNVARGTGSLADIADQSDKKLHSILHPRWPTTVGNWVERIGVDVGRVFAP